MRNKMTSFTLCTTIMEESSPKVNHPLLFIESTLPAVLREIRMLLRKELPILARIILQPTLRLVSSYLCLCRQRSNRVIGRLERAFAVPSVARSVFVPKWVIDGARQLALPEHAVLRLGIGRHRRHPSEVGHDVLVALELSPVGRVVCSDDGRVVLGLQPGIKEVVGYAFDVLFPLSVGLQLTILVGEFADILFEVSPIVF